MIDRKDFERMKDLIDQQDEDREKIIKKTRDVLKLSKQIIYSVHRKDMDKADKLLKDIRKEIDYLNVIVKKNPKLDFSGSIKIAFQEYVEAIAYYYFVKHHKIPKSTELKVDEEYYLLGLCDLSGELVRHAINSAIHGDYDTSLKVKEFVSDLYELMHTFDFRNGDLRKKVDSMKYDMKKLEDLVLELKLKNKIK